MSKISDFFKMSKQERTGAWLIVALIVILLAAVAIERKCTSDSVDPTTQQEIKESVEKASKTKVKEKDKTKKGSQSKKSAAKDKSGQGKKKSSTSSKSKEKSKNTTKKSKPKKSSDSKSKKSKSSKTKTAKSQSTPPPTHSRPYPTVLSQRDFLTKGRGLNSLNDYVLELFVHQSNYSSHCSWDVSHLARRGHCHHSKNYYHYYDSSYCHYWCWHALLSQLF